MIDEALHARARAADDLEARLAAALLSIRQLLAIADANGYMPHEQQQDVRAARALLVEESRHAPPRQERNEMSKPEPKHARRTERLNAEMRERNK